MRSRSQCQPHRQQDINYTSVCSILLAHIYVCIGPMQSLCCLLLLNDCQEKQSYWLYDCASAWATISIRSTFSSRTIAQKVCHAWPQNIGLTGVWVSNPLKWLHVISAFQICGFLSTPLWICVITAAEGCFAYLSFSVKTRVTVGNNRTAPADNNKNEII